MQVASVVAKSREPRALWIGQSRSNLDGIGIPDSYFTTGVFSIGSSYTFSSGTTLDLKLGIGLTEDSPDVIFSTALPFRGDFGWGR